MQKPMNDAHLRAIVDEVQFGDWEFYVGRIGGGWYIQLQWDDEDNFNPGVPYRSKGRKWYLSPFATRSEIVFTCWAAVELALRHEAMEKFKFEGVTILNPHRNVDALLATEYGMTPHPATEVRA